MKHILFIGHDASLTGAPMVLLHFLRWLKRSRPDIAFDLVLLNDGPMVERYREICSVYLLREKRTGPKLLRAIKKVKQELAIRFGAKHKLLLDLVLRSSVVVGSTGVTLPMLASFKKHGVATLCWVHELDSVIDHFYSPRQFRSLINSVSKVIACSQTVAEMLSRRNVTADVTIIYEFIEIPSGSPDIDIRKEIGIPDNAFVVGTCGAIEPRKGVDLFIEIAYECLKLQQDAFFIWIGGRNSGTEKLREKMISKIVDLNIDDRVKFVDPEHPIAEYYQGVNVFLLPSREDPFPLVCLEAAAAGKPVVCFADAGGMPEFVRVDAGVTVPFLDTLKAGEVLSALSRVPDQVAAYGLTARERLQHEYNIENSASKLLSEIESLMKP